MVRKMKAEQLFASLDEEFELDKLTDDEWGNLDLGDNITENFKTTRMGLALDNTDEIHNVYTAVFPSERVLDRIISSDERNVLLFTHHPMIWDPRPGEHPFRNIPHRYLDQLKKRAISYYSIHVPLDRNGPYSTTVSLAKAIEIDIEDEFFDYFGVKAGIIGKTECKTVSNLVAQFEDSVGHPVRTWAYGSPEISNQRVALVAGGGNYPEIAEEISGTDVRNFITGVTMKVANYEPSLRFHELCEEHKINVISATHYSTEKFACIAVLKFFDRLGLSAEFIEDEPNIVDYSG
ncbi:MAG: Nif3-like dinuclear metal center hexameric protein [Candidatus Thorarchaeota archaeon]